MPRKSRIDAPCALHHIIARGIDRGKIFQDPTDKRNFLERLGEILIDTETSCYAWALIPNHFHLAGYRSRIADFWRKGISCPATL